MARISSARASARDRASALWQYEDNRELNQSFSTCIVYFLKSSFKQEHSSTCFTQVCFDLLMQSAVQFHQMTTSYWQKFINCFLLETRKALNRALWSFRHSTNSLIPRIAILYWYNLNSDNRKRSQTIFLTRALSPTQLYLIRIKIWGCLGSGCEKLKWCQLYLRNSMSYSYFFKMKES